MPKHTLTQTRVERAMDQARTIDRYLGAISRPRKPKNYDRLKATQIAVFRAYSLGMNIHAATVDEIISSYIRPR